MPMQSEYERYILLFSCATRASGQHPRPYNHQRYRQRHRQALANVCNSAATSCIFARVVQQRTDSFVLIRAIFERNARDT
jgi:hypothetical protein